jgi:hypothetical protein
MKLLDSKGRLFGKINVLDFAALLVIVLVIVGIFFFPGRMGSLAPLKNSKTIEVDVIVRALGVRSPENLIHEMDTRKKLNIIIRNQPYGQVEISSVKQLPRTIVVTEPDGSAKEVADPRANTFAADFLVTLVGKAQITENGAVFGNNKVKIGSILELEGFDYDFNATVIDVRIPKS